MNKLKKNNIVKFPEKITDTEREVEAIIFAAAEPLSIETKFFDDPKSKTK